MDEDVKRLFDEMRRENADARAETRRHFDVIAERLESKVDLVAEGVDSCNKRIDHLEQKMSSDFDDVRSMIRFSHHELDRRVRTLEETVADLQSRVERLESSTH